MKNYICLFVLILLLGLVSADLGTFRQGECVKIKTILNASSVNISTISYPNSTVIISNKAMTKTGQTFSYTFCNTSILGTYIYDYFDNSGNVYVNSFEITPTGNDLSSSQSVVYIIIFIISFIIFIGLLTLGIYLPEGNKKNEMTGYIIAVSNLKYLKLVSLFLAYLTAMILSYFSWMVSYAYLEMEFIGDIFRFLFYGEAILILPIFILFVFITIANLVKDNKIADGLTRGLRMK